MHYKSICDAILSRIRAAINSETFLNQFKEPNRFTRKRLISMYQVIVYLFYSNKAAMFLFGHIEFMIPLSEISKSGSK